MKPPFAQPAGRWSRNGRPLPRNCRNGGAAGVEAAIGLRAVWSRPVVPGGLTAPLRVTVRFEILRGGALADIALASTSGHPPLDRSALRAAYDANPLPPLPDEFEGDRLAVNFYFELRPEP